MNAVWETPRIAVEEFAPNDYVSACWNVYCRAQWNDEKKAQNLPTDYSAKDLWGDYANYQSQYGEDNIVQAGGKWYQVQTTHTGSCTDSNENAVSVNGNNIPYIKEHSSDQGWLTTNVVTSVDKNSNGIWDTGDLFSWITFGVQEAGKWYQRIWLHWGLADSQDSTHPNRS